MNHTLRRAVYGFSALLIGIGLASVPLTLAFAAGTATIANQPPASITAGTPISFALTTAGFTNPSYTISDSFAGSSLSNANIDASGNFHWTPTTQDVGAHTIALYVYDSVGDSATITQMVTITSTPTVFIQSLAPGTSVAVGSPMTFTAVPTGFQIPIAYAISDTYGTGTTVTSANMNSSGNFTWTPTANELGTHTLVVTVTDPYGHTANVSQQVSVASGNLAVTYVNPSNTVTPGVALLITLAANGFSTPNYTVTDSFPNSTIAGSSVNPTSSTLAWTPTPADVGTHTIVIHANDAVGNSGTATTTVTVNSKTVTLPPSLLAGLSASDMQEMMVILKLIGVDQPTIDSLTASYNAQHSTGSAVGAAAGFTFTKYLAPGMTNSDVTQLQTVLAAKGFFSGSLSGYFGSITKAAVIAFQNAHGLSPLGVVGPQTRAALNQQ